MLLRSGRSVAEIFAAAGTPKETVAALEGVPPAKMAAALKGLEATMDAISFVAHALPRREATFWAFTCARSGAGDEPEPSAAACMEAAKAWITEPTEANRRATMKAAEAAGMGTPAGAVALAAFLSGPTLGPENQPAVPPDEHAGAKAIVGAVALSALALSPDDPTTAMTQFLERGLELADRVQLWSPPPPPRQQAQPRR